MNKKRIFDTKTIVYGAFLVTIALLLGGLFQRFTGIPTVIKLNFGGASQNIGFTAVPLVIASLILGPFPGAIVAFIYDTLSFLLLSGGAWNPIFTISEMAIGFFPGLIYVFFRKHPIQKSLLGPISIGLGLYTLGVALFSSAMKDGSSDAQKSVQMLSFENGIHVVNGKLFIAFILMTLISIAIMWLLAKKKNTEGLYSFDKLYIVTFVGILSRSLISGWGLWLYLGKTVPLIFYFLPRFVTVMFLTPITVFMISSLSYILKRYSRV